ncbi:MAG: SCO family protein [Gaiellales bacterium]
MLGAIAPLVVLACIASACGSSGSASPTSATTGSGFAAPLAPAKPVAAPAFTLKDQFGKPISLKDYRGKAVLLTFLYVHCPDVCPLITAALRTTTDKLGANASKVQVIAISVDPVGDTVKDVRAYLKVRGVLHRFQYLVGTRKQLAPVWNSYHIDSEPDPKLGGRLVGHTGIVIGIDAAGKERTYYPSSPLKPAWMIHDVPLLANA